MDGQLRGKRWPRWVRRIISWLVQVPEEGDSQRLTQPRRRDDEQKMYFWPDELGDDRLLIP